MANESAQYSQAPSSVVAVGDVIDKYRVERIIGTGAMGIVVAARHTTLEQVVAIKLLVEHRFGSREESIARFVAEARAAARIESDHVCRVSDVGNLANGIPYMVMEHLEGNDLEDEIVRRGQLDLVEAVDFLLQALDAIAAAHKLGIVHRDLKPANLFLTKRPDGSRRVKVLDFGISKGGTGGKRFTQQTRSLGTPAYMPPEQIREPMGVDHRADLWALGAILYEAVTGQMPFVGKDVVEVLDRVLGEEPCPIEQLRRDVPPQLVAIVGRALVRDRELRWQSAAMFARALSPFGSIGVLSSLASIQREVGSLSSIGSIAAIQLTPSLPATAPSHAPREPHQTQPDPSEIDRRHHAVQDWTAEQARRRQVRATLWMAAAGVLVIAAAAILLVRFGPRRVVRASAVATAAPAAVSVAAPLPASASTEAMPAGVRAYPASSSVHPASSSVYPARHPMTKASTGGRH